MHEGTMKPGLDRKPGFMDFLLPSHLVFRVGVYGDAVPRNYVPRVRDRDGQPQPAALHRDLAPAYFASTGRTIMSRAVSTATFLLLVVAAASAQEAAKDVARTVDGAVATQQATQSLRDDWAMEREALRARYRSAQANVDYLRATQDVQQARVDALAERIGEYDRRLTEAARLRDGIQDTLDVVMRRLEQWVADDLPFLPEERAARVANLKEEMAQPDIDSAEKLRRLLEALQVEAGYGANVDVDEARIVVDGEELYVDVLRIGRLSLFWKTPDGSRIGEYDRGASAWRELDGGLKRVIVAAMEMATHMRPVELLALPVGRISR
jgi:hypothetical protein